MIGYGGAAKSAIRSSIQVYSIARSAVSAGMRSADDIAYSAFRSIHSKSPFLMRLLADQTGAKPIDGFVRGIYEHLTRPHKHHIVFKGMWIRSFRMRNVLDQSRKILDEAGIDYMTASANIVRASNIKGMHTISQAKEVLARLKTAVDKTGNGKASITAALEEMKEELKRGRILDILHPEAQ